MIAQTVAAIVLVRNTIGSVQKSRTGKTRDVSQKAPKLGTLSMDLKYRPSNPDARAIALISRRRIEDGRDSFINKQRIAEKPDTAADKLKTHGLRSSQLQFLNAVDHATYHPRDDVLVYVATAGPMPRAATADAIHILNTQILERKSNIFSKLLTATVLGKADVKPQIMRPAITAGRVGLAAIETHPMVKATVPVMYKVRPPKVSAIGGNKSPPKAWASR